MRVRFWGTRGSLPSTVTHEHVRRKIVAAIREFQKNGLRQHESIEEFVDAELPFSVAGSYGCNTSCVEIENQDEHIICDAGAGLRDLGQHVVRSAAHRAGERQEIFHIFLSHLHWDHIQGFPFFVPAYIPGYRIHVYGFHDELQEALTTQQDAPHFPVPLKSMKADIRFTVLDLERECRIAGFTVRGIKQNHPGASYGYSFEKEGKKIVYSTDCEHKSEVDDEEYPFVEFFRNADLLIYDAQYNLKEAIHTKEDWGHSSNLVGVELAVRAGVKRLCLYHNEPTSDDWALDAFFEDTRRYLAIHESSSTLEVLLAYDGLIVEV
ncbi:MAG: MBL fold metallo-hydrolase [Acidobacteriota bacterium]